MKKEQQLKAEYIRVTEEVKVGFHSHLDDALEVQKLEAERKLKDALASQVSSYLFLFLFLSDPHTFFYDIITSFL